MTQKSIIIVRVALLAILIVFIGATGKKVPLLSNIRVDIILLVIIGMAICTRRCRNGAVDAGEPETPRLLAPLFFTQAYWHSMVVGHSLYISCYL